MHKSILNKFASYTAVAASTISIPTDANAAIVGYNVDPDSILTLPNDEGSFAVNINNIGEFCDDIDDFSFNFSERGSYQYLGVRGGGNNSVYANANVVVNYSGIIYPTCILPTSVTCAPYAGTTTYTWWSAEVFEEFNSIGPSNDQDNFHRRPTVAAATSPSELWGDWNDQSEKYIGLKFQIGSNTHYGWILMDVENLVNSYTIRAWAYNETPNEAISMNPDIVNWQEPCLLDGIKRNDKNDNISVYGFNNEIHVNLRENKTSKGRISVYAMDGKQILSAPIKSDNNSFRINHRQGLYIVKVDIDGKESYSKKVY
ncbi:MAG: T9SS type A sorting domain-containing protein [Flavobacteriales bacterium]|nr:T9SS type A sorting domain-containing protein [Flavobacteriales bacterium]